MLNPISRQKSFGGWTEVYTHPSEACRCEMRFAVIRPPQADEGKVPVLYWLSGLTCTEENFITKSGAQRAAAQYGVMIVVPDTSPRGKDVASTESYSLGLGAGFYVDAIQEPWARHYSMYSYVTRELPEVIHAHFPTRPDRESISGHSMGGHGALICALKNPTRYQSVSAFAPIVAPSKAPWGKAAFSAYLGADESLWGAYDACELVRRSKLRGEILVDQGLDDKFLTQELMPGEFEAACRDSGQPLRLRKHPGYDHSYYFISSFIDEHIAFHSKALKS